MVFIALSSRWELSSTELVLLSLVIHSQPECSSRDIPIFLPQGSPKVSTTFINQLYYLLCALKSRTKLIRCVKKSYS